MTYPLIALLGKKRVGKDTFADFLVEEAGYTKVAFADTLRELLLDIDPFIENPFYTAGGATHLRLSTAVNTWGWEGIKTHAEPLYRYLLRNTGRAIGNRDKDFFIRRVMTKVATLRETGPVVVTDTRFLQELIALETAGAHSVRITRDLSDYDDHITETMLDHVSVDTTIDNIGLEHLRQQAIWLATRMEPDLLA